MKNRGFTVIEVLIVVAIIGILAAITIPALDKNHKNHVFCYGGYVMQPDGRHQMLDEKGRGILCPGSPTTAPQ